MSRLIRINPRDNVAVALQPLKAGEEALGVTLREDIPAGHKFALCDIAENENVVKYGFPIGHATQPISAGSWVHTHNVKTNLSGLLEYGYHPHPCAMRSSVLAVPLTQPTVFTIQTSLRMPTRPSSRT